MKKILLLFIATLFIAQFSFGQTTQDAIEIRKAWGGLLLFQHGNQLSLNKAAKAMEFSPIAYKEMKSAKTSNQLATIMGLAGGILVGLPIGSAIAGEKPNWALAGVGVGIVVATIPLNRKIKKRVYNAVEIFNNDLQKKK